MLICGSVDKSSTAISSKHRQVQFRMESSVSFRYSALLKVGMMIETNGAQSELAAVYVINKTDTAKKRWSIIQLQIDNSKYQKIKLLKQATYLQFVSLSK
ncbi:hypothetical protein FGO68_gene14575 [Halteria grandinella]|uniref:Uncharacterized protein n=1 Tax=Halteria grandinella TaxID=5974 RepID=A0A8J8NCP1_HALGN|nr:hypothetical protein FGO68_gene14575 [Halteria grandinella]